MEGISTYSNNRGEFCNSTSREVYSGRLQHSTVIVNALFAKAIETAAILQAVLQISRPVEAHRFEPCRSDSYELCALNALARDSNLLSCRCNEHNCTSLRGKVYIIMLSVETNTAQMLLRTFSSRVGNSAQTLLVHTDSSIYERMNICTLNPL